MNNVCSYSRRKDHIKIEEEEEEEEDEEDEEDEEEEGKIKERKKEEFALGEFNYLVGRRRRRRHPTAITPLCEFAICIFQKALHRKA
ncbi:hypothetical protein HZH68_012382 [Vespula germanica]|uniref:Uncharacterized protein n=1 Tax=Vespula germanica TaxID=30212 RepID=A0A834MX24_VESGE|nr:hypothetical protein HZH68_012382 [Vespula germanica]